MLTNKYMNYNFFLNGFSIGTRYEGLNFQEKCGVDARKLSPNNSDFANKIEFYTTQPINIDRLASEITPGTSDFAITSTSAGKEYTILSNDGSDFTTVGAADSVVGTVFTATGVGVGDGTATDGVSQSITALNPTSVYTILSSGDSDFTTVGAADSVVGTTFTATGYGVGTGTVTQDLKITELVVDTSYTIIDDGASDFTLIGAADSIVGTLFTATGAGTGPGVVTELNNGSRKLLSFNLLCTGTYVDHGKTTPPSLHYYSNDDNQSPVADGTSEWFLLKRDNQVLAMGEVSESNGTGNIKLSTTTMTTSDLFRFYSLDFSMDGIRQITTDPNTVLVSV